MGGWSLGQELMANPDFHRMGVSDHLILPVQRITRYVMLVTDLVKHTEPTHADYRPLQEALEVLRRLSADVNEAKRKEESMTKLFQIQKEVENCPVKPHPLLHTRTSVVEKAPSSWGGAGWD
jgi:hypothetical protein